MVELGADFSPLHCVVLLSADFSPLCVVVVSADLLSATHKGASVTAVSQGGCAVKLAKSGREEPGLYLEPIFESEF